MKFDTMQEYFDQALAFFATMPRQSTHVDSTICTYYNALTQDACIVGQFMDDDLRHKSIFDPRYFGSMRVLFWNLSEDELAQVIPDSQELIEFRRTFGKKHIGTTDYDQADDDWKIITKRFPNAALVQDLQSVHDDSANWDENGFKDWNKLHLLAEYYRLKFTMPDMRIPIRDENTDKISSAQLEMAQF